MTIFQDSLDKLKFVKSQSTFIWQFHIIISWKLVNDDVQEGNWCCISCKSHLHPFLFFHFFLFKKMHVPMNKFVHLDVFAILWKQLYLNVFIVLIRRKERLENTRVWTWCFEKENVTSMCQCCTENNKVIQKYIEFDYGIRDIISLIYKSYGFHNTFLMTIHPIVPCTYNHLVWPQRFMIQEWTQWHNG